MAHSGRKSRKRASSDQLREQATRNVRPAKGKSITKGRPEGLECSSQRPLTPPIPAPIDLDDSGDNSEYEQQESPTDVDDENMDMGEEDDANGHRRTGNHAKGQRGFHRDVRMMAVAGSKSAVVTVVGWRYKVW